jgi:hypothetical protein
MMADVRTRIVACAWCSAEISVPAPDLDENAYFILPRQCHGCAGHNVVEILGRAVHARRRKRAERRREVTQEIVLRRSPRRR